MKPNWGKYNHLLPRFSHRGAQQVLSFVFFQMLYYVQQEYGINSLYFINRLLCSALDDLVTVVSQPACIFMMWLYANMLLCLEPIYRSNSSPNIQNHIYGPNNRLRPVENKASK